mmetsp:Transcript_42675/g.84487  ORF Transcript_42675/g.84487 Transcript_42675/m.84487 type:complete len:102 (-) Transcript_42675:179-484(-)
MSEPKIRILKRRLKRSTYKAFVDCVMVREMTITGSATAGFLNARKMRVSRIKRRTTKPPFSDSGKKKPTSPGSIAARSIKFAGPSTNLTVLQNFDALGVPS